jgi:hypothetical protein
MESKMKVSKVDKLLTIVAAFTNILGEVPTNGIEGKAVIWGRLIDGHVVPYAVIHYDQDTSIRVTCEAGHIGDEIKGMALWRWCAYRNIPIEETERFHIAA